VRERVFARSSLRGVRGDTSRASKNANIIIVVERRRRRPRSRCRVTATPIPPSHPQSSDREFFRFFPCLSVSTTCVIRSSDDMSKPASFASALANPHIHTSTPVRSRNFHLTLRTSLHNFPPSQQSSSIHRQSSLFFVTRNSNFIPPITSPMTQAMK
jgi:hypothetical protein